MVEKETRCLLNIWVLPILGPLFVKYGSVIHSQLFLLPACWFGCRFLVFEGKLAESVSPVELHQVKTLGVAKDPDTGNLCCPTQIKT